jgi:hypothetical protein
MLPLNMELLETIFATRRMARIVLAGSLAVQGSRGKNPRNTREIPVSRRFRPLSSFSLLAAFSPPG